MDPDRITEADINDAPDMSGLLTYDEWWEEHRANICCTGYTRACDCGGYTDEIPSEASRLLVGDEEGP